MATIYKFPEAGLEEYSLDNSESPSGDKTTPYLDITPELRKHGEQGTGAFNKAVLKKVYELNKNVGSGKGKSNHRILYVLNFSGDKWFIPIGEYADDSNIFTFYIQGHNVNNEGIHLNNDEHPVAMMCTYEEIVSIGSMYFRVVDDSGEEIGLENTKIIKKVIKDKKEYLKIIEKAQKDTIGSIPWAIDFSTDLNILYKNFLRTWEYLNTLDVSSSKDCITEKESLFKSILNIFWYRYMYDNKSMPSEFWQQFVTKYADYIKLYNIADDNESYMKRNSDRIYNQ